MFNKEKIDKILRDKDDKGWFPPVKKLLPDTVEEFEALKVAEDKEIKEVEKEGLFVVEIGKVRSAFYPECSICDYDAKWGIESELVHNCKVFRCTDEGCFADGEPCKTYRACSRHLREVADLCKKEQ